MEIDVRKTAAPLPSKVENVDFGFVVEDDGMAEPEGLMDDDSLSEADA